jgi:hypothetical protein
MQRKHKRKSCGDYIRERIMRNRDRAVEEFFSQLEKDARRELLIGTDAARKEMEKHETRQIQSADASR